jgi:hypothetical protein
MRTYCYDLGLRLGVVFSGRRRRTHRLAPQSSSASQFTAGGRRVLDLKPVVRATRSVRRAEPLRYDTLATALAGMLIDNGAVALVVLVQRNAGT